MKSGSWQNPSIKCSKQFSKNRSIKKAQFELQKQKKRLKKPIKRSKFRKYQSRNKLTPLNGVIGMTELASMTHSPEQQQIYLDLAKYSAGMLLNMINDILDFSKIEAKKWRWKKLNLIFGNSSKSCPLRDCQKAIKKKWKFLLISILMSLFCCRRLDAIKSNFNESYQ